MIKVKRIVSLLGYSYLDYVPLSIQEQEWLFNLYDQSFRFPQPIWCKKEKESSND